MQVLAVHIDRPFLKIAILQKTKKQIQLINLKSPLLDKPENVKQLYNSSSQRTVVSGISAKDILIRPTEIKTTSKRHLEQALSFQAETTSYLPANESFFVPYITEQEKTKTKALIFSFSKKTMKDHLEELKQFDIDPDIVSAIPIALVRYIRWRIPALTDAFIIDIGSEEICCIWMEGGKLQKAISTDAGIEALLKALWSDRKKTLLQKEIRGVAKHIDLLQLQNHLSPNLSTSLNALKQNLLKILYSFHRLSGPKPIVFTGRVDGFTHFKEFLLQSCGELCSGEYEQKIPQDEQKYAIAIGLALDDTLQFRKDEFFPKKSLRRTGIYTALLILFSFFCSATLLIEGKWVVSKKEKAMISYLKRSLENYDPSFKNSLFSQKNREDILHSWARSIAANTKEYPYIVQVPTVSEILHILDHHPLIVKFKETKDPIDIISFDYKLVSLPTLQSTKEPYRAKVNLIFKTKNALNARQFHEALLQEKDWIDTSQEISWEPEEDSYRVGFFLKKQDRFS